MNGTPSIEQFVNADFNIIQPGFVGGEPAITVENAIAPEPFYFEITVEKFGELHREALNDEDAPEDYVNQALEIETELNEDFGILL